MGDWALRLARRDNVDAIDELMKTSTAQIFPRFYDEEQTRAGVEFIFSVDPVLIEDETFFVIEAGEQIVGCGGWSRRDKLFTGSGAGDQDDRLLDPATEPARIRAMFVRADWTRRGLGTAILRASEDAARAEGFRELELMATLPGVPLYERYGFTIVARTEVQMPGGVKLAGAAMRRPISAARSG